MNIRKMERLVFFFKIKLANIGIMLEILASEDHRHLLIYMIKLVIRGF